MVKNLPESYILHLELHICHNKQKENYKKNRQRLIIVHWR